MHPQARCRMLTHAACGLHVRAAVAPPSAGLMIGRGSLTPVHYALNRSLCR